MDPRHRPMPDRFELLDKRSQRLAWVMLAITAAAVVAALWLIKYGIDAFAGC